jgi:hypothetical protein
LEIGNKLNRTKHRAGIEGRFIAPGEKMASKILTNWSDELRFRSGGWATAIGEIGRSLFLDNQLLLIAN